VAGFAEMAGLKRTTEVATWRTGGDNACGRKLPGGTEYEPVTLERGVTSDQGFHDWANRVDAIDGEGAGSLTDSRKDLVVEVLDATGRVARTIHLHGSWVSEYQAVPELAANASGVAIETLELEHEGWELDG
jgi:phage tail-like protein